MKTLNACETPCVAYQILSLTGRNVPSWMKAGHDESLFFGFDPHVSDITQAIFIYFIRNKVSVILYDLDFSIKNISYSISCGSKFQVYEHKFKVPIDVINGAYYCDSGLFKCMPLSDLLDGYKGAGMGIQFIH